MTDKSKVYLSERVNPILEQLVTELIINKPDNVCQFMIKWLQTNGTKIEATIQQTIQTNDPDSPESDDEEDVEINLEQIRQNKGSMRTSVSAEAYGMFNKKTDFKAKSINKSEDQKQRIKLRLEQAFMFQSLDENEKKIVIDAMIQKKAKPGDTIIRQGEDGDMLYVVDKGELDCYKIFKKGEAEKKIKVYKQGEAFGQLALLYNAPRAATIKANTEAILFGLDRETFNHIVKDAASRKREKYENFLARVDLLQEMAPYQRLQVADALKSRTFQKGQYIVREGDTGDVFYILENGECNAVKEMEKGPQIVLQYQSGDYFGELALLKNARRAASIVSTSQGNVVYLDRDSFQRILGPIEDILRRNFAKYQKYMG